MSAAAVRDVVRLAPPRWSRFWLGVALASVTLLCGIGLLSVAGALISKAALRPPVLSLGVLIVGVRFFGLTRACSRYAERLVTHDVAFRALADLRGRCFARVAPLVPGDVGLRGGDLLARFVGDVDRLQDLYLRAATPPLAAAATSVVAVAVAFVVLPAAAAVLTIGLLLAGVVLPLGTARAGRSASRRQAAARAGLTTGVLEVVEGAPELVAAGRGAERRSRLAAADSDLARLAVRDAIVAAGATAAGVALQGATAVAITIVAIPAVKGGALDGILLAALVFLTLASFEAVAALPAAALHLDACATSAERVLELTRRRPEVTDPPAPLPVPPGALALEDVHLARGGRPVLRGASLRLAPGRSIALIGASGAGKTTIAHLLVRFLDPDAGSVRLGGADVRSLGQDDVRSQVCLIAQDARLFTTTIAENVRLARPGADDRAVAAALVQVGLSPWLATLPEGAATTVGEDGALVSGGQRQRIALARGLLSDSRFLILDEPTVHLDPEAAAALLDELPALTAGRGLLVIAHDTHPFVAFDSVLELADGRLTRRGPV